MHASKLKKIERKGDKKNSPFFEEFLSRIYDRRESSGLHDLLGPMRAVLVQVQTGDALSYLAELYLMTPYRFHAGYANKTHRIYILRNHPVIASEHSERGNPPTPHRNKIASSASPSRNDTRAHTYLPDYIVLEPLSHSYRDRFSSLNSIYPKSEAKLNAKYMGEIYRVNNLNETQKILEGQQFRFLNISTINNHFLCHPSFAFTKISYYTGNIVGYTESDLKDYGALELGTPFTLDAEARKTLEKADAVQKHFGLHNLIHGIDHLATRVLANEREDAILEFLSLSNYYFWGAYTIEDMNSSTNICRNPDIKTELHSPAKVFTANNVPYYANSIVGLPSPTEDFVRNYGKRMHHIAYEVEDGATEDGTKYIDFLVDKLIAADVHFLEQVIGECRDFPDLKQIFSKSSHYSTLVTEYVQRCEGFDGFFTKSNVAYLTHAAGQDEALNPVAPGPVHD
ncbi:hypothetical protein A3J43_02055 [Candidatus Uhrbacteria bacterium RIFCSPHIGHO2_12_FULL_54_23]|uniref:Uncharacterized protein n=3 Tax=Candidatus Uhriibacteriota TaxID=1752732 RepID=A0A1F7UMD5_9BACT|nr:MAG: hypothetical protein A3J43_02055 [Candidatus Uhrbacteria bacterium RIFCSPHIGHO2_12_FULL_54_23]OGL83865.1 MAG: hypothetical protein A3B36_02505 [Candidatus Uhrbacteria bacterium RIFCSPLOWO2_01_FULL_55_36]OGL91087.1 MAG: hypothetical protein A3J36_00910 [Candidatus Uhrbacteria bacterium RIFCSPLOWO2_02_FULL_54_37]